MATLETIRAALLPGGRLVAPDELSEIGWVRAMKARVPAFDALEPGDVAIVPASALEVVAGGTIDLGGLVEAFRTAPVAGVVLLEADEAAGAEWEAAARSTDLLDELEGALATAGLPTLRAAADAGGVERSLIGLLVNERAELDRQAAILEARLETLAIEGAGPAGLLAAIGEFLGRPIALEGRRGDTLAVHAPAGVADAPQSVARYHGDAGSVGLRVELPEAASPARSIALLGPRPPTDLERIVLGRVSGVLALELARDAAVQRAGDSARRAEALPAAGPPWVVLVARQRAPGMSATVDAREAARRELRLLAPASRMALRGDAESLELRAVLAGGAADQGAGELGARIARFLDRTVALSRPFGTPGERPAAEAEARATLEAAEALDEPPAVARADRLPAYRLLGSLHNLPDGTRDARALLEPILAGRADVRREHLATLRAVLDQPGLAEAAAALGVHRNTVAYRVRRIEQLTGWRLSDPDLRLPLALAVRLVQNEQG